MNTRLFLLCLLLFFCSVRSASIYDILSSDDRFTVLKQQIDLYSSVSGALTNNSRNYTLFAPVNSAFELNLELQNIENRLKYYIADGLFNASDLEDSTLLPTLLYPPEISGPLNVRITKNDTGSFVQWSQLNESIEANNGRVYVLKVLYHIPPPSASIIDDVDMFSVFKDLISRTDLSSLFSTQNTTIFLVPDEYLLNQLNTTLLNITDANLTSLLQSHIVNGVYYAQYFQNTSLGVTSYSNRTLSLTRDSDGSLNVEGRRVLYSNLLSRTGVIHILNGTFEASPIPTNTTPSLIGVLNLQNARTFLAGIKYTNLSDLLETSPSQPLTVIAPLSSSDITNLTREVLQYHIFNGTLGQNQSSLLSSQLLLESLGGFPQRIKLSRRNDSFFANQQLLKGAAIPASNGEVFLSNEVLRLPLDVDTVVKNQTDLGLLSTLLEKQHVSLYLQNKTNTICGLLKSGSRITFFAPNNQAISNIPSALAKYLLSADGLSDLTLILSHHIYVEKTNGTETRYSSSFVGDETRLITNSNETVRVYKRSSSLAVESSNITEADIPASNGVIHLIDKILLPNQFQFTLDKAARPINTTKVALAGLFGAGLSSLLSSTDKHTFFLPTDAAFAALTSLNLSTIAREPTFLLHVADGVQPVQEYKKIVTRYGENLVLVGGPNAKSVYLLNSTYFQNVTLRNGTFEEFAAGALLKSNIIDSFTADNGLAYVIDTVLRPVSPPPPPASSSSGLLILIIVLIVVAGIVGVGFYLYRRRQLAQAERLLD